MSKFENAVPLIAIFTIVTGVTSVALDIAQDLTGFAHGVIALAAFGPALGALAVWLLRRAALGQLVPPAVSSRQAVAHLVLGVAASAVFFGLLLAAVAAFGNTPAWPSDVAGVPLPVALAGIVVGALLQELGWRGVLQPLLEHTGSRMLATLVVGAVWGFWVVQLFPMEDGFVAVASVFFATVALSVLLGHFGNGSVTQRVLAATVVHALVAVGAVLVLGAGPVSAQSAVALLAAMGVTAIVFMGMFVVAQRKRARAAAAAR